MSSSISHLSLALTLAPRASECLALRQLTSVYCKFLWGWGELQMLVEERKKPLMFASLELMFDIFASAVEIFL